MPIEQGDDQAERISAIHPLRTVSRKAWHVPVLMLFADTIALQGIVAVAIGLRVLLAPLLPIEMNADISRGVHLSMLVLPLLYLVCGLSPGYGRSAVDRLRVRVTVTASFFAAVRMLARL